MKEHDIFIQGWNSCKEKITKDIESVTDGWVSNGPSRMTAEFIIQRIQKLPTPIPEEENTNAKRVPDKEIPQ